MNKDDLKDALYFYVLGACVTRNDVEQLGLEGHNFQRYVSGVQNVVFWYLLGTGPLGSSCSDFECHLAHKAEVVFKKVEKPALT